MSIPQGAALSLTVGAGGTGPFTYQWLANTVHLADGGNVSGSATSNLVITPALAANSGSYSVIVSNSYGSVTSKVSAVTVGVAPDSLAACQRDQSGGRHRDADRDGQRHCAVALSVEKKWNRGGQ